MKEGIDIRKPIAALGFLLSVLIIALGCGGGGSGGGGPAAVVVLTSLPANNTTGVALTASIVITFNQAMNQASAQGAFSIAPNVAGAFSWNAGSTVLTFTPNAPLTGNTQYTVTITTAAQSAAGGALAANFVLVFTTFDNTTLPGPPGDPAGSHIPDFEIVDPPAADIVSPSGVPISVRDLIVIFKATTTVSQANALIQSLPAEIAGGDSDGKTLLLRLTGNSDLTRVLTAQATLLASPLVQTATINMGTTPSRIPPLNINFTNKLWNWEVPYDKDTGNWHLKAIRMPQAWNLLEYAQRRNNTVDATVLEADEGPAPNKHDVADPNHPDLSPRVNTQAGTNPSNHATMVAGFIGAAWDNRAGVEGVNPRPINIISRGATYNGTLQDSVTRQLRSYPNVRVLNYSAGYRWLAAGKDPVTALVNPAQPSGPANPTLRKQIDLAGNTFLASIEAFIVGPTGRNNFLMFCAAGNDRLRFGTQFDAEARDMNVCNNVAWRFLNPDPNSPLPNGGAGGDHFIAVEATDSIKNRAGFSTSGGQISAPGACVRATEFNDGNNYDSGACTAKDAADQNYGTNNGTSFASPITAGVAAYLWSLNTALEYFEVRAALIDNGTAIAAGPQGGAAGANQVDGFAAALWIDT
ncbi:MAG: S8 family serine peptidase, partial [bacterium]